MLKNRMSFRVAFCGILAALMTVIMLVGPLIPTMTYVAPSAWAARSSRRTAGT